jgi:hypothetical protein
MACGSVGDLRFPVITHQSILQRIHRMAEGPEGQVKMEETQRKRRGHNFLPPKSVNVPMIKTTTGIPMAEKSIPLHYFCAAGDWYIAEADFTTGEAFGYVKLAAMPDMAEWGYIDLNELEQLNVHHGLVIVERDMYWTPVKFSDIK